MSWVWANLDGRVIHIVLSIRLGTRVYILTWTWGGLIMQSWRRLQCGKAHTLQHPHWGIRKTCRGERELVVNDTLVF